MTIKYALVLICLVLFVALVFSVWLDDWSDE